MKKAPAPYDGYPYYGRYESDPAHAPFMIVRCLMQLGLSDWSATLLFWLGRYDGLEGYMEEGADPCLYPVLCVRDVLIRHAAIWPAPSPGQRLSPTRRRERMEAIVEDVLQLEFIGMYAWWGRLGKKERIDWDSLEEDWLWFIQLGPDLATLQQKPPDDDDHDGLHVCWRRGHKGRTRRHPLDAVAGRRRGGELMPGSAYSGAPAPSGLRGLIDWLLRRRLPPESKTPVAAPERPAAPPPVAVAGSQPNWLRMLDAQALLQVVQADKAIAEIWRMSRFSRPVFKRDCLRALHRYAEFVQLLPASEAHHHAHAGGLLSHTIEMLLAALTWCNGRLLPEGSPIEIIDAQRDE